MGKKFYINGIEIREVTNGNKNIFVKEKEPYSLDYTITEHDFRLAVNSLIIATKEYQEYVKLKQANEDFE